MSAVAQLETALRILNGEDALFLRDLPAKGIETILRFVQRLEQRNIKELRQVSQTCMCNGLSQRISALQVD